MNGDGGVVEGAPTKVDELRQPAAAQRGGGRHAARCGQGRVPRAHVRTRSPRIETVTLRYVHAGSIAAAMPSLLQLPALTLLILEDNSLHSLAQLDVLLPLTRLVEMFVSNPVMNIKWFRPYLAFRLPALQVCRVSCQTDARGPRPPPSF